MNKDNSHFDTIAYQYDETLPAHITAHYRRKRVNFIKKIIGSGRILDVGCGTGELVYSLSREGYRVFGIDKSIGMLNISEKKRAGIQVQADSSLLPFQSATFDLVMSVATLHHIADPSAVRSSIIEMLRIVKADGYLLIWDHNPRNPYWKLLMRRVPQDCGIERLISHREILKSIKSQSSHNMHIRVYNLGFIPDFIPESFMPWAVKFEAILEKMFIVNYLSAHNVILVKKR
jgi:ubiquinone/menaquinone biosynthesis C-methylase UbiE